MCERCKMVNQRKRDQRKNMLQKQNFLISLRTTTPNDTATTPQSTQHGQPVESLKIQRDFFQDCDKILLLYFSTFLLVF